LDIVGGMSLANGREVKILTGIDDHSRFVVCAGVMARATSKAVCEHFAAAMRRYGVPAEVLTDNGKQFTGRFGPKDVEVLFDRICRENGIDHLLTAVRSPTTTGKVERFHRTLREEFMSGRVFDSITHAQEELDTWIATYNQDRPHSSIGMVYPVDRFTAVADSARSADTTALQSTRVGDDWVTRTVAANGLVSIAWQQISCGKYRAGRQVDVHVTATTIEIWDGQELARTVLRTNNKEVRKKRGDRRAS